MRLAGLAAIYQRPNTSKPAPAHKIYPYLLGGISIERVNQVWCADVTYIPMAKGFLYLVVIMDWVSPQPRAGRHGRECAGRNASERRAEPVPPSSDAEHSIAHFSKKGVCGRSGQ
jgi:putative transposase